jgi:YidC/Oxa1 family membrane protein insertase
VEPAAVLAESAASSVDAAAAAAASAAAASEASVDKMLSDPALAGAVDAASGIGYSPVSLLVTLLDTIHLSTGAPWWATIIGSAVAMRLCLIPLTAVSARSTAKLALLKPDLERISAELKAATTTKHKQAVQLEMADLMKRNGAHPLKPLGAGLAQAPFMITFFMALRRVGDTFPDVAQGGALWFHDLSVPDSLYILPIISAVTMLATIELSSSVGNQGTRAKVFKNIFRGVAVIMVPFTATFPAALFMYWIPSNLITLSVNQMFKTQWGMRTFKIPVVPDHIRDAEAGAANAAVVKNLAKKPTQVFRSKREREQAAKALEQNSKQ